MNNSYYIKAQNKEIALSAEELLTMFNRNITKNAELLDYIGRSNLFEIIGKARNESVHSRFIAELLSGIFFNADSRESTLFHFLDLLLYRCAVESKSGEVNPHLKNEILKRSVLFEKAEALCELPVTQYRKSYGSTVNARAIEKDDRLDIYLQYKLTKKIAERDTLEIFIENKVNSSEFDSQTVRYFEACDNGGRKRPFQLFVYLTSQSGRDMDDYISLDKKYKPASSHYIHICYQDILDYIIEPMLADERLDADKNEKLNEYVSCLELPAMPDEDSQASAKDLSIMAISTREKQLVNSFMEDPINRRIVEKTVETKLGEPLYSVTTWGTLLNSKEALNGALLGLSNTFEEPLEMLKEVADCSIVGKQNGANPFLIYSPEAWRATTNYSWGKKSLMCKYLPYEKLYVCAGKVLALSMMLCLLLLKVIRQNT
ncbi:MAG: PD-(D/E)XK nuclease family protein, partial [Muribaculaceae bacterium]|nr:PD-(D/E)XK nuclease family protein [Muribaculaceae bacterium]